MKFNADQKEILELFRAFDEEMKRKPPLKTWFSLLLWSLQNSSIDAIADEKINSLEGITIQTKSKSIKLNTTETVERTSDLNDNCFVVASDLVAGLAKNVQSELDKKMTAEIFFDSITESLHQIKDPLFEDADQHDIEKVTPKYTSIKSQRIKKGDVISIPLPKSLYAIAVVFGETSFGTALIIVNNRFDSLSPNLIRNSKILDYLLFTTNKGIQQAKWKKIYHDDSLLSLFSAPPEMFHSPLDSDAAKPFGLAQAEDGSLRKLSKEEADKIGVGGNDFQQVMLPEEIENYLDRKLGIG